MNTSFRNFLIAPLAAVMFCTACVSADQITRDLELAVDAAIAAAPAVEVSANVPPATQAIVAAYLGLVQTCLKAAAGAETTTGITAAGAAAIAAACGSSLTASPTLPTGTAANVVTAVTAVSASLSVFLQALPSPTTAALSLHSGKKFKLDSKKLDVVKNKLEMLDSKLKATKLNK